MSSPSRCIGSMPHSGAYFRVSGFGFRILGVGSCTSLIINRIPQGPYSRPSRFILPTVLHELAVEAHWQDPAERRLLSGFGFKNNCSAGMWIGSEEGSYLRLIDRSIRLESDKE